MLRCDVSCNEFVVSTVAEYIDYYELDEEDMINNNGVEYNLICDIICLQIAYYLMRRTSGCCGGNNDNMSTLIQLKKTEYKDLTGKSYKDPNEDVDW